MDDDMYLLRQMQLFLRRNNNLFDITTVTSATDALKLLEEQQFNAIVCDYRLAPDEMNGLELLEWIRNAGLSIPFIMFTGYSSEDVAIRALNLGADFYLIKGTETTMHLYDEIAQQIQSAVKRSMGESELTRTTKELEKILKYQTRLFAKMFKTVNKRLQRLDSLCKNRLETVNKRLYDQIHAIINKINVDIQRVCDRCIKVK